LSRIPIRLRLTAAFALAMLAVVVAAGAFTYRHVRANLDETINDGLDERADAVIKQARRGQLRLRNSRRPPDVEESIAQLLAPSGRVLQTTGSTSRPAIGPSQLRRAATEEVVVERVVPEIDGPIRVLGRPVAHRPGSPVVAVGQALDDRNDVLRGLLEGFLIIGPVAVAAASLIGYLLAAAGLAPIEAMRRRASEISPSDDRKALPLPAAHDEVRRLGETLNQMLDRLRRAFERERRFVADASHELRTPVAVVKAELEAALRSGDYGPRVRDGLLAAIDECDRLSQLAEDLLVIARSTDGRLPLRPEKLHLRSVLDSIRLRFADRADEQNRRIRVDAPDELVVHADPLRIRQALGNLVDNALRHGAGEIVLGARPVDAGVTLDVADQGSGFSADIVDQAFQRFTRGDPARTRGGAGLGMAIVREIAEAHGGWSAIVPGASTRVRLWLPDSPAVPSDASPVAASGAVHATQADPRARAAGADTHPPAVAGDPDQDPD
jgi:two-component system, OmpR family, sensor kinase